MADKKTTTGGIGVGLELPDLVTRHSWRAYKGEVSRCARRKCAVLRKGNPGDYKYRVKGEDWARGWVACSGQPTTDR